jgi:cell division protein WhiA
MTFSTNVKNEIIAIQNTKTEGIAELSAFLRLNANVNEKEIMVSTENAKVAKRIFKLIKEIYNISSNISVKKVNLSKNNVYIVSIKAKINIILEDLAIKKGDANKSTSNLQEYIVSDDAEKRAYLRGAFLGSGSVNDPKTTRYHLEFLANHEQEAIFLKDLLNEYELNSKIFKRHKGYMIYIKEAEKIGDFLRIIGANRAVLYFEDIRIYRDHKNTINRLNNCEQANIEKIISTANKQLQEIKILIENVGITNLDEKLKEVIDYRLRYPEKSLTELSEIMSLKTGRKVTKSGLNHRFRKIRDIVSRTKK